MAAPIVIGSESGINTATMPTHQENDLLLVWAFRSTDQTTPITVPAGWTTAVSTGFSNVFGVVAYKIATSSSETTGTWTNATSLTVTVFRNVDTTNPLYSINISNGGTTTPNISWPLQSLSDYRGNNSVVRLGGVASGSSTMASNPPPTFTLVGGTSVGSDTISVFFKGGVTTNIRNENTNSGVTGANFRSYTVEIKGTPIPIEWPQFKGAADGTTSATIPTHQTGDLLLAWAFRDGSTTLPTLPSGWVSLTTRTGTTCCARLAYKIATSSSETTGTWTNATSLQVSVFRDVDNISPIGVNAITAGTVADISYPSAGTMNRSDGSSTVVRFAAHRSTNTSLETPPSGYTLALNTTDATDEASTFYLHGATTADLLTTSPGGTASGWVSATVEIKRIPVGVVNITLDGITALANNSSDGITVGAISVSSISRLAIGGTSNSSVGAITTISTSELPIRGTSSNTIGSISVLSNIKQILPINVLMTLGEILTSSTSRIAIAGESGMALGEVTSSGTSIISSRGDASATLDEIIMSSTAIITASSISEMVIDAITISSTSNITVSANADIPVIIGISSESKIELKAQANPSVLIVSDSLGKVLIVGGAASLIEAISSAGIVRRDPFVYSNSSGNDPNFQTSGGSSDWPYEFSTFTPSDNPYRS